jgi:eukaryotic-like serine/threonine-protein kinase
VAPVRRRGGAGGPGLRAGRASSWWAWRIDDELARGVWDASRSQVAYFHGAGTDLRPVGTTLSEIETRALAESLRARATEIDPMMAGDDQGGRLTLDLAGRPWLALVAPLRDARGRPVGTAATLASLDEQLATYRRLQWLLTGTGAAAVLLAMALAYPLTRRSLRPVRDLAAAAEAARRGDYDRRIDDPEATRWGAWRRPSTTCWPACGRSGTWRPT